MSALFQVELVDTDRIHPNETVGNSSEPPERRQAVRRDW
jgi:hypothetical protein